MFRKLLSFLAILMIGFQIPLIVILSGAQAVSSKIAEVEAKLETTQEVVETAGEVSKPAGLLGGFMGTVQEVLPVKGPIVSAIAEGMGSIFATGQENIEEVKELIAKIQNGMYISIALTLLLIILLALLQVDLFFRNLGAAFILGGLLTLLNAAVLYYFFILHFDATFKYLYDMAASGTFGLGLPFVGSVIKSFAKDFVVSISNLLVMRSFIVGAIVLGSGIVSLFLQRLLGKR